MKKYYSNQIKNRLVILAILFLSAVPQLLNAQAKYKLGTGPDVVIKILGASNIHDWTMTSTVMESQGDFKLEGEKLIGLTAFNFSVTAKSLKSEHSSMDNRTYKAIKADQYPKIDYKLVSATVSSIQKNKYLVKTKGDLTIAGATQPISMDVTATINTDNTITCTGSEKLKLTDYKIEPPSFMLGAMKVYNDLTIQFNLVYQK